MSKTINIADKEVPVEEIKKGECYLYEAGCTEQLYMKMDDNYHQEHNAFNVTQGFLVQHDNIMVVPVDVTINVSRK